MKFNYECCLVSTVGQNKQPQNFHHEIETTQKHSCNILKAEKKHSSKESKMDNGFFSETFDFHFGIF